MKTHWKKLRNPNYIGSYELMDGSSNPQLNVTIDKVVKEVVQGADGKSEECTVAHLKNQKPLILNATNSKMIESLAGSPFIEDWANLKITLYIKRVKAFGEMVDALRIKKFVEHSLVPGSEKWNKAVQYLQGGGAIEDIQRKYKLNQDQINKLIEDASK